MALTEKEKKIIKSEIDRLSIVMKDQASRGKVVQVAKAFNKRFELNKLLKNDVSIQDFMETLTLKGDIKYYSGLFRLNILTPTVCG